VSVDDVVDVFWFDSGAPDGFFAGDGTEFHRSEVAQLFTVAPHRSAGAGNNSDVFYVHVLRIFPILRTKPLER